MMLRRTGGTCGRFRFGSVEGNATSQTGARQTCSRANRKCGSPVLSGLGRCRVVARVEERERERGCDVVRGLGGFILGARRGVATRRCTSRRGGWWWWRGGNSSGVCRDSGVSLSALQAARRSAILQWARRRGVVCQRRHKTSRKRQRGMCEIPRRGGSLCWS